MVCVLKPMITVSFLKVVKMNLENVKTILKKNVEKNKVNIYLTNVAVNTVDMVKMVITVAKVVKVNLENVNKFQFFL